MKRNIFLTALLAGFSALTAAAKTVPDTLVVTTTPQMHCAGCENKIQKNIRFVKGVKQILTSVPRQEVTIVYDGRKAAYSDFVAAFAKIGYEIKKKTTVNP